MRRKTAFAAPAAALIFALITPAPSHPAAKTSAPLSPEPGEILVRCHVYHDQNADGVRQAGEPGLPSVGILNGVATRFTDAQGNLDVLVDRSLYRFATLRIPAGYWPTTPWYRWVPLGTPAPVHVHFGLKTEPRTTSDPLRWVHISDTQVLSWGTYIDIRPDLQSINELADPPLFLVNTGDLVEVGSDETHWDNYVTQIATSQLPLFNVPGNHDTLGTATPLANYEKYVGPPYYDMDLGSWHFIFYNSEAAALGTPAQDQWLDEIFATVPAGKHLALFQHRMLAEINQNKVNSWAQRGLDVNFSGHWHSHLFAEHPRGILDYNLSRTSVGPNDRTPRSFGIVTCTASGEVSYELHRLDVDHRANLVSPRNGGVYPGPTLDVLIQAYDTSSPVASLGAFLAGPLGSLAPVALQQEGISLWRAALDVTGLGTGVHDLDVSGSFEDGRAVSLHASFLVTGGVAPAGAPFEDWPMFRKCAAGSSFTATPLEPPLAIAWATPLPGMVELDSPVVSGGKVYIGCRTESGDLADSGVLCCDAGTGAIDWFTPVPGGVALAPAVSGGIVMVTAMTDSAFGLDASSGQVVWRTKLPGNNYRLTAPIFEAQRAWLGGEPQIVALDPASGQKFWTSSNLGPSWYSTMYTAPAINETYVYCSFYGTPGIFPDGLAILDRSSGTAVYQENGTYRSAICAGETVYVVGGVTANDQVVTARTVLGSVLWSSPKVLDQGTGSPALGHGILVVGGADGAVEGFRASNGANLWTRRVGASLYDASPNRLRSPDAIGTPAIADSIVYIGASDGNLYAYDLASGVELSRTYLGTPIASSPAISGNMLFVGASDGHVYGFVGGAGGGGGGAIPPGASFFALHPPRPNPSAGTVVLEWVTPASSHLRIDVVDVSGREVATLVDEPRPAGQGFVRWDGRNSDGNEVAAGIYFVRLRSGDLTHSRKLVRLRP